MLPPNWVLLVKISIPYLPGKEHLYCNKKRPGPYHKKARQTLMAPADGLLFLNALRPLFYCCLICYNKDTDFSERTVYDLRWLAVRVRTSTDRTGRTNFFREKCAFYGRLDQEKLLLFFAKNDIITIIKGCFS